MDHHKTHSLFYFSLFLLFSFTISAFDLATIPFNDGYSPLFGDANVVRSVDGNGVQLLLDRYTGNSIILLFYYIIIILLYTCKNKMNLLFYILFNFLILFLMMNT